MARSGSSLGVSVVLALILWFIVLIVLPAAYLLVGPGELWQFWDDARARF
jgi:hypothetical protein